MVRMPHNNRVSTSGALNTSDIWSKTIGHDPHAGGDEPKEEKSAADEAKARGLMELARHQNVAGDATRDDFARKMYLGLKPGKKHRSDSAVVPDADARLQELLGQDSSSSEDELVKDEGKGLVEVEPHDKDRRLPKDRKRKDRKQRKKRSTSSSDDSDGDSSDESSRDERRRKRRKREKRKRKHRRTRRYDSSSDSDSGSSSSTSDHRRRKRSSKHKKRRRDDRKKSEKRSSDR